MKLKKIVGVMAAIGIVAPGAAMATNGMNLEGYGPIATGMGGASMAYDNGVAAVMNNPATMGLAADGSRFDIAVGSLGPDVKTDMMGMDAPSAGDAYYMPAMGYMKKAGKFAYGVGIMAQGGMGTEYGSDSVLSMGTGLENRTEVGVGRLAVPLSYNVNNQLTLGGSIDYIWAGMDLRMVMSGQQFMGMAMGDPNAGGTVGGSMMGAFMGAVQGGMLNPANPVNNGYFDFSNDSDYSGKATSKGWGGKLGVTYKFNNQFTMGATYHTKSALDDMEGTANVTMNVNMDTGVAMGGAPSGTYMAVPMTLNGKISVRDFQWPETFGLGVAYQVNDRTLIAADYKRINWADVMKNFKMTFSADGSASNGGFANTDLDATLTQDWDNQDVFMLGVSYKTTPQLTLRAGLNIASNPIPDNTVNPLFPATVEEHYTLGAGYDFNKASALNFSFTYAPDVKVTNPANAYHPDVNISHGQANWQLMYSHRF